MCYIAQAKSKKRPTGIDMTELPLFLAAGIVAIAAAILMLLSSNAVHSALFLVITMVAIAFLFLLLNAPFLAMIQITVYAGAIMVLFLFVIMLLGSEQPEQAQPVEQKRFRWFLPAALTLALTLLFAIGLTIVASVQNPSNLQQTPGDVPRLRIVHAVAEAGPVDVQLEGETIIDDLEFREGTEWLNMQPGVFDISLVSESGETYTSEVSLTEGAVGTLIAYSDGATIKFGYAAEDLSTVSEDRSGRLIVFNAYPSVDAIALIDTGSDFVDDDTTTIVGDIGLGIASAPIVVDEGEVHWRFVQADAFDQQIAALPEFEIERNVSDLVILTDERFEDGSVTGAVRPTVISFDTPARLSFGGPQAIGFLLFTDYLLPFQLLALLLLAAMVGAIVLTHRQMIQPSNRPGVRRRVSRPLVNVIAAQVGHDVTEESEAKRLPADEPEAVGN